MQFDSLEAVALLPLTERWLVSVERPVELSYLTRMPMLLDIFDALECLSP